jgi:hypothetical protein
MIEKRSFLALIAALLFTAPAQAAALAVRPGEDNDRMSVIYADSACGTGVRCDRAHMGCRSPGEFFLSVLNLPKAQVQAWMLHMKGRATLTVDGRNFAFTADSLDGMQGKTGLVDVAFFGGDNQAELWAALAPAKQVDLNLGDNSIALAGDGIAVDLEALAAACKGR